MSYDCTLVDPVSKKPLETASKHEITGGTYCIGGTTELWLMSLIIMVDTLEE